MTDLPSVFERLGLVQYLEAFTEEGFDSWETVLCITESDLDALNVKLGHRRKLQREIAHARGVTIDQVISPLTRSGTADDPNPDSDGKSSASQGESRTPAQLGSKRRYRRHPKPDENAPERPPSAYVIFSNKTREELRPLNLSFTEIAKAVGERWQSLQPHGKEPYETKATSAKEVYNVEMGQYKRTRLYQDYQVYLSEFKARYGPPNQGSEAKRPKVDSEAGFGGSSSGMNVPNIVHSVSDPARMDLPAAGRYSPLAGQAIHPGTSVSAHRHRLSSGSQGIAPLGRPAEPHMPPTLSRIRPLEPHSTASAPAKLELPVPEVQTPAAVHPRRSNRSPATLNHRDTSKSSGSDTFSSASAVSSQVTPLTPIEEPGPSRKIPPLVAPGNFHDHAQSGYMALAPKPRASGYTASTPVLSADHRARPVNHDDHSASDADRSQSCSIPHDSQYSPPPPAELRLPSMGQGPEPPMRQDGRPHPAASARDGNRTNRMDALSVLALAGHIVDRESDRPSSRGQ